MAADAFDGARGDEDDSADSTDSPGADRNPFARLAERLAEGITTHEAIRNSDDFLAEQKHLRRVTQNFVTAIRLVSFIFTRYSDGQRWLLQSSIDDFLESAISIVTLAEQGVFNVGRRELRYMLESAVKCVFVDQALPGDAALVDRIAFASDAVRVPRSSVDVVDQVRLGIVPNPHEFRSAVHSTFGTLSGYTHVSKRQLEERYRRSERGEFSGFESATTLRTFVRLMVQTYDLVLALIFEGIGPSFTGDLFVEIFDEEKRWAFHKTRFVKQVSRFFDYKAERQRS